MEGSLGVFSELWTKAYRSVEEHTYNFKAIPNLEADTFAVNSNLSTDAAPPYPWRWPLLRSINRFYFLNQSTGSYDADSNHEPCRRQGYSAHWALLTGRCCTNNCLDLHNGLLTQEALLPDLYSIVDREIVIVLRLLEEIEAIPCHHLWLLFHEDITGFWNSDPLNCYFYNVGIQDNLVHYLFHCPFLHEKRIEIREISGLTHYNEQHVCKWQILKSIGSDHLPILIEISTKTKTSSIKEKFWNFKKANWNLYQQNTNEDFRKAPTRIKDLEQNWISFKNTIIKAAKVSIPRGNIKKWIPNYTHQAKDIQTLITKRNELQKKYTQNQTNCRTELNIVNEKIKRLYVNMKREKWKQTCENLNPRNPNTKLWHLAKQIDRAQPQTENTNMIKNIDGTPATNDKNAANLLGNSYQMSSKIKFEIKDKKVEKKARKIIHDCKNVTSTHNIFHEKINMKELDYALENTDLNKTPGPDGIHGQMISNLGKNGKEKLLDIFNNSWKTGKLPQDWKTATIIPIKKLDKSADDPKNYRPISLTSICCKLMEKIILRRLTYHLDTRNLLPEEQYGFRKGHGTIDQLLFFTQKVKDAQNRKPTNHTIAAFLDLTQAFDKVWKNKLITKLYKHFKIDGKAITWINDFLKNRYIRVKYNGTLSKTFKLYQGLPQGSVLSPTLFTLFIAGIEEKISHKTNIGLFADDIILWSSNTNWKKAERDLNKTLFHLEKFANKHKLEFNPQKSETCLFTTDKKLYKIRPKIILIEQQLQYNKHPEYLGYTLDPEINSSKHIEEVIRKGRDRLKILKYISGREWGADATTLKLTYTSLIRPILEYGYQIYGTASETNLKSLERIQLSAARIITGLRNTCPNDIVLYEADIMPLKDRRSYNLPKYINKIKSYGNKHRTS
ncbi:hypothetical protein LAZ67_16000903, partial [Cordylochernes scorpioides]